MLLCMKRGDCEWWGTIWRSFLSLLSRYSAGYKYILGNCWSLKFVETALKNSVSTSEKAKCLYYRTWPLNAASENKISWLWESCDTNKYAVWAKGTVLTWKYTAYLVTTAKWVNLRTTWGCWASHSDHFTYQERAFWTKSLMQDTCKYVWRWT
jgi:hypothetical protein